MLRKFLNNWFLSVLFYLYSYNQFDKTLVHLTLVVIFTKIKHFFAFVKRLH